MRGPLDSAGVQGKTVPIRPILSDQACSSHLEPMSRAPSAPPDEMWAAVHTGGSAVPMAPAGGVVRVDAGCSLTSEGNPAVPGTTGSY